MIAEIRVTDTALPMIQGAERQMPFAVARALTWVAEDVKFKMAEHVGQSLTIREPWVSSPGRWVVTPAKKQDYPNQVSRVDLDHEASFLADFETGKVRYPGDRAYDRVEAALNTIYIPTRTLRPTFTQRVPQFIRPKAIGVSMRMDASGRFLTAGSGKHSRRKKVTGKWPSWWRGRPAVDQGPAAGIWERFGTGQGRRNLGGGDNIRFLWKAVRSVRIPKKLRAISEAQKEVLKQWPDKMLRSFSLAMATAKPARGTPWSPAQWMARGR